MALVKLLVAKIDLALASTIKLNRISKLPGYLANSVDKCFG
jgi:hypothetical protein